jgi:hypothetical protein
MHGFGIPTCWPAPYLPAEKCKLKIGPKIICQLPNGHKNHLLPLKSSAKWA